MTPSDPLTSDLPIARSADDQLHRFPFATLIARTLLEPNRQGATVVGLCGEWGTGKTSVANLVIEKVGTEAIVVQFEPWMVGSPEALAREFFLTLGGAALPKQDTPERKQKRKEFYRYAAKAVDALSITSDALGTVIPGVALVGKGLKSGKKALDLAAQSLEELSKEPTLRQAREHLSSELRNLGTPVVFIIDDIDRLEAHETRLVLQIIKACANFPNVRYLLLFDRSQVLHAVQETVKDPAAYLEKIITQVFDLPEATRKQREKLLDQILETLPTMIDLEGKTLERMQLLFDGVLLPGLTTIRQVKRFLRTASALLPGLIVDGFKNVDMADFLALEYMRQFVPNVYAVIREEEGPKPGGFVGEVSDHRERPNRIEEERAKAVEAEPEPTRRLARECLRLLFDGNGTTQAHRERRFCSVHWRDGYLGFDAARASLPESEWSEFRQLLASEQSLTSWLAKWENRDHRRKIATAMADRAGQLSRKEMTFLMVELAKWAETRPYETSGFFNGPISWTHAIELVCGACLESLHRRKEAPIDTLGAVAEQSGCLMVPALLVGREVEHQRSHQGYGEWSRVEDIQVMAESYRGKLRTMVDDGSIWSLPDPRDALHCWHRLITQPDYTEWLGRIAANPKQLASYLNYELGPLRTDPNFSRWWVDSDGTFLEAVKAIDESLLTEDGKWARENWLRSADATKRDLSGEMPYEDE
jgi:hypothetical protein